MRGGTLDKIIEIERSTKVKDALSNERKDKWKHWRTLGCGVEYKRGREFFEDGQRYSETVVRFTVRFFEMQGVTTKDRIVFEGNNHDIKSIVPDRMFDDQAVIEAVLTE